MLEPLLKLDQLSAGYGEALVLERIGLELAEGESVALLGRNGAGKSTLLLTLMGLTQQRGGTLHWRGASMAAMKTPARAQAGIAWVPQERLVFGSLSVEENLTVVARNRLRCAGRQPGATQSPLWTLARIYALFPRLLERRGNLGSALSGGEQQMLAIARALMTNPQLLLLDEPMEGLAPLIMTQLREVLAALIAGGLTVIIVEQHARLALQLTSRALVLERGRLVHDGSSAALLDEPQQLEQLLAIRTIAT
ncbi:MAG: ABC transporter ATP-binding protein [Janthinobacterium lividum]